MWERGKGRGRGREGEGRGRACEVLVFMRCVGVCLYVLGDDDGITAVTMKGC